MWCGVVRGSRDRLGIVLTGIVCRPTRRLETVVFGRLGQFIPLITGRPLSLLSGFVPRADLCGFTTGDHQDLDIPPGLTIDPPPAAVICGAAAWAQENAPSNALPVTSATLVGSVI